MFSTSSVRPGMMGASITPQRTPASARRAIASSRCRGLAVSGSMWRQTSSLSVATLKTTVHSATAESSRRRLRSRSTLGDLVMREQGPGKPGEAPRAPAGEAVLEFRLLVRVAGGADRDVLPPPGRSAQLAPEHLDQVDLDDDAPLEVAPGVVAKVLVVAAGEAVDAGVLAAPVGGEAPAQGGQARHAHPVQCALALDLLDGHLGHGRSLSVVAIEYLFYLLYWILERISVL